MYGLSIRGDEWRPVREFLPRVETSPAGNVVLPVGRELQPAGESGELRAGFWTQYAYMVLTQHEALALADELRAQVTAAQAAGRRGTEDLLRCNPDESAGVREELELADVNREEELRLVRERLLGAHAYGWLVNPGTVEELEARRDELEAELGEVLAGRDPRD